MTLSPLEQAGLRLAAVLASIPLFLQLLNAWDQPPVVSAIRAAAALMIG